MTAADRPERPTDTDREAVARLLAHLNGTPWDYFPGGADDKDPYQRDALGILTTRDPAARAALIRSVIAGGAEDVLDALVEAGWLTEERRDQCAYCGQIQGLMHPRECAMAQGARYASVEYRRLAQEAWEPVAPRQDGRDGAVSAADATKAPAEVPRAAERREDA